MRTSDANPFTEYFTKCLSLMERDDGGTFFKYYKRTLAEMTLRKVENLTKEEMREIKKYSIRFRPQECFRNAQLLVTAHNSQKIEYVEGHYLFKDLPLPLEHAWNRISGKDFDATPRKTNREPLYFGRVFTKDEVVSNMLKTKRFSSVMSQQVRENV